MRVLIYHVGGTIGMVPGKAGLEPDPAFARRLVRDLPALYELPGVKVTLEDAPKPIDSSEAVPADWYDLAAALVARRDAADAFVVLHGTDTMAYGASFLSFLLQRFDKPVVLTGSQVPFGGSNSDAPGNMLGAVAAAAAMPVPEVGLFFAGRLMRGNRSTKRRSIGFTAFESPNYPPLAESESGSAIKVHAERFIPASADPWPGLPARRDARLALVALFPGIAGEQVAASLNPRPEGFVILGYGCGNGPSSDRTIMEPLEKAVNDGAAGLVLSWCGGGRIDIDSYAAAGGFRDAGLIGGKDMTLEAAMAKLHVLIGRGVGRDDLRRMLVTDLCGELTE